MSQAHFKRQLLDLTSHLQVHMLIYPCCGFAEAWAKACKRAPGKTSCTVPFEATWIAVFGENLNQHNHKNLPKVPCRHTLETLIQTVEAKSLIYNHGALWWYGGQGLELKRMTLDKGIPCDCSFRGNGKHAARLVRRQRPVSFTSKAHGPG